jgi:hypothetical protein
MVSTTRAAAEPQDDWRTLADGVEYRTFTLVNKPEVGDGVLHVVRADPSRVDLKAALVSEQGGEPRPAGRWLDDMGLVVGINIGMYDTDQRTNVGYLRNGSHVSNPKWRKSHETALAFGPKRAGLPPLLMVDLDTPGATDQLTDYGTVVQNLRLVKGEAQSVWKTSTRRWSEAAVAVDKQGRLLFLFCRTPMSMTEFNDRVLELPVGIVRAMHVEGGPEASLSIHTGALSLDLSGSYETGFNENDGNAHQWPIPNVLGVAARKKESPSTATSR